MPNYESRRAGIKIRMSVPPVQSSKESAWGGLKGRNKTAQGNALGIEAQPPRRPEGAKQRKLDRWSPGYGAGFGFAVVSRFPICYAPSGLASYSFSVPQGVALGYLIAAFQAKVVDQSICENSIRVQCASLNDDGFEALANCFNYCRFHPDRPLACTWFEFCTNHRAVVHGPRN